tara:strand:+ start:899 stop:2422 length:1524 start_codon:yes stop_codon:yes gene_type:complete
MSIIIGSEGHGAWGGKVINYILKKINYIDIQYKNSKDCDVIISSHFFDGEKQWNTQKKRYIYWTGESVVPDKNKNELQSIRLFSFFSNLKNCLYVPFCLNSPHLYKNRKYENKNRKYVLAYCNSNKVEEREEIFNLFVKKAGIKLCNSYGKCHGIYPETNKHIGGGWGDMKLIDTYKDHKFVIAMENCRKDGYVTEKILNAFYSGAIPIYWGSSNINDLFNPKAFINVNSFKSFNDCVHYAINMSQQKITRMTNEKIYNETNDIINLLNPTYHNNATLERYKNVFKQFLDNSNLKTIHMCYSDISKIPQYVYEKWHKLNPEYKIKFYGNKECYDFLRKYFSIELAKHFNSIPDGPIKADLWRPCILYIMGGVYADIDVEPLVPLRDYITDDIDFLTCISYNKQEMNPILIYSHPKNNLLYLIINKLYNKRHKPYKYLTYSICPTMYNVLNNIYKTNHTDDIKNEGLYILNNEKYKLIKEVGGEYAVYNNKRLFNNHLRSYYDHQFQT